MVVGHCGALFYGVSGQRHYLEPTVNGSKYLLVLTTRWYLVLLLMLCLRPEWPENCRLKPHLTNYTTDIIGGSRLNKTRCAFVLDPSNVRCANTSNVILVSLEDIKGVIHNGHRGLFAQLLNGQTTLTNSTLPTLCRVTTNTGHESGDL